MKSISISLLIILCSAFSVKADVTIVKSNGGKDGYWVVNETHTNGSAKLTCTDPGCCSCVFSSPSCNVISTGTTTTNIISDIEPYVEGQIGEQNYQGQYVPVAGVVVSWTGTDSYNYVLTITGNFSTCE